MLTARCTLSSKHILRSLLIPSSSSSAVVQERRNAWRACLGKIARSQYLRHYPVTLIRPDGSTVEIRYLEPRAVVQLPVDLNALTEEERRHRLAARKPKTKKIVQESIDDNFDPSEYMRFWSSSSTPESSVLQSTPKTLQKAETPPRPKASPTPETPKSKDKDKKK